MPQISQHRDMASTGSSAHGRILKEKHPTSLATGSSTADSSAAVLLQCANRSWSEASGPLALLALSYPHKESPVPHQEMPTKPERQQNTRTPRFCWGVGILRSRLKYSDLESHLERGNETPDPRRPWPTHTKPPIARNDEKRLRQRRQWEVGKAKQAPRATQSTLATPVMRLIRRGSGERYDVR